MSRSGKGKGERSGRASLTVTSVTPEVSKYSQKTWSALQDRDETAEFITEIIDDLLYAADCYIYGRFLTRQLIPFTVMYTMSDILQIVEWLYLVRDGGPTGDKITWSQDQEPYPAAIDSWSQGCVPKKSTSQLPPTIAGHQVNDPRENKLALSRVYNNLSNVDTENRVAQKICAMEERDDNLSHVQGVGLLLCNDDDAIEKVNEAPIDSDIFEFTDSLVQHEGSIDDILERSTSEYPGWKECRLTNRNMSAKEMKECIGWYIDKQHGVPVVNKGFPQKLPNSRIETLYTVMDARVVSEMGNENCSSQNKILSTARFDRRNLMKLNPKESSDEQKCPPKSSATFESIEVTAGVSVKELNRIRKGPKLQMDSRKYGSVKEYDSKLQPIRSFQCDPKVGAIYIGDGSIPNNIRPPQSLARVPPITRIVSTL